MGIFLNNLYVFGIPLKNVLYPQSYYNERAIKRLWCKGNLRINLPNSRIHFVDKGTVAKIIQHLKIQRYEETQMVSKNG